MTMAGNVPGSFSGGVGPCCDTDVDVDLKAGESDMDMGGRNTG